MQWLTLENNWREPVRFMKNLSNSLKYEHCSIRMPNSTFNDTRVDKLFPVKYTTVFVDATAIIGGIRGTKSDIKYFTLYADGENGGGKNGSINKGGGKNGGGNRLDARKLVYFFPFVMILIQGYVL